MFLWYQYKKTILISLTVIVLGLLGFWGYNLWSRPVFEVQALDITDTNLVRGWIWTDTVGWISMSCLDTDQCEATQSRYGVRYDNTSGLTGFAWSDNVGWIVFGTTKVCSTDHGQLCYDSTQCSMGDTCDDHLPTDYSFNSHCSTCTAANNCTACYVSADRRFYGWAKVASLGDDGWVRLDGSTWGLKVKDNANEDTYGDFYGWAWNGGTFDPGTLADSSDDTGTRKGLGWLSFNSSDTSSATDSYYVTGKPTKPRILSVERTEGEDTTSLTIIWNDDVLGETSFDVLKKDSTATDFDNLVTGLNRNVIRHVDSSLERGQSRGYKVKACNIFGCSTSAQISAQTSPINIMTGNNIDTDCFTDTADTTHVNLAWNEPFADYDGDGNRDSIDDYEIQYCVLEAGETRADCTASDWQLAVGGCSTINGISRDCHDVLDTGNGRYGQRYNIHIYRIRALGPATDSECNGGVNTGDACYGNNMACGDPSLCVNNVCVSPSVNSGADCSSDASICKNDTLCARPQSSWGYYREVRPCPKAGQPEYQEVRPE